MKKSIHLVFRAFAVVTVLLSGCAPATTPSPSPIPPTIPPTFTPEPSATPIVYNVEIDVADGNGKPIPNAKIIQGKTVEFTDDQGVWHKPTQSSEFSGSVWAQGYLLKELSSTLQPGDNKIAIQLSTDPFGLQPAALTRNGYKLAFVDDFQDRMSNCTINGNGNVVSDDTNPGNYLLLVDLRNIDQGFTCSFGPTNIQDAIIEVDFRYPSIRFTDYQQNSYYNWQGYDIQFRDGFDVEGYPLQVPWGPTLQIRDFTGSDWKYPITLKQGIQENRWYTLSTKYDGKNVEVRMNGLLRFTFLNPPTMINTTQASIGAFGQANIAFDNIKMWVPNN
jgi:hypothetical protein